jgi:hypothetical protein
MMTQGPSGGTDIGKDNGAAVFYAQSLLDVSLPVGSRRKAGLYEKTSMP